MDQYAALRRIREGSLSLGEAGIYCLPCQESRECRLGIRLDRDDESDGVSGTVTLPRTCEGGPGVAHGGMVLAVLEEALGSVHTSVGLLAVTVKVDASIRRPVPVLRPLTLRAALTEIRGRRRVAHATISCGEILAEAVGESVVRDPDRHFGWASARHT